MKIHWHVPGKFPNLDHGQLHVWRGIYVPSDQHGDSNLSQDEQARSERFRFASDRGMFRYSHSLLRRLLAGYVDLLPGEIEFGYTKFGKPFLNNKHGKESIEFNLSHSGDVVLIGITRNIPLGVDVEKIKPLPDLNKIAARFFSDSEQSDLSTLSGSAKIAAFYHCWTRKEAVIKATGEGLSMPLDSFRVSFLPGEPARLIKSADQRSWLLKDVESAQGYAAAVAAPVDRLQVIQFSAEGF